MALRLKICEAVYILFLLSLSYTGLGASSCSIAAKEADVSVSFCTNENIITSRSLVINTTYAPKLTAWNCQCSFWIRGSWYAKYEYEQSDGQCPVNISLHEPYRTTFECKSQTITIKGSHVTQSRISLMKQAQQSKARLCFIITNSSDDAEFAVNCSANEYYSTQLLSTSTSPTSSSSVFDNLANNKSDKKGSNIGAIVGGTVGSVVFIIIIAVVIVIIFRRKQPPKTPGANETAEEATTSPKVKDEDTVMTENYLYIPHSGPGQGQLKGRQGSIANDYTNIDLNQGRDSFNPECYAQVMKNAALPADSVVALRPHATLQEDYTDVFDSLHRKQDGGGGGHVYIEPVDTNNHSESDLTISKRTEISEYDSIDENKMLDEGFNETPQGERETIQYDYAYAERAAPTPTGQGNSGEVTPTGFHKHGYDYVDETKIEKDRKSRKNSQTYEYVSKPGIDKY